MNRVSAKNRRLVRGVLLLLLGIGIGIIVVRQVITPGRDETWTRITSSNTLRVCTDASYPPFESIQDDTLVGFDVDLARALANAWGVDVQFIQVHFDGLYDALRIAKCDLVISALPYDRTMTRDVLYSQPYMELGQVLLVTEASGGIQSWRDLGGRRVAVELGSEAHQLVRQLTRDMSLDVTIDAEREPTMALANLREGRSQALAVDRITALGYLKQYPELRQVGELRDAVPLVIASSPNASYTIEQVNQALEQLRLSGKLAEFEARWF